MSDNTRQSFTDKASAAMKPDSQKSMTEHASDKMKGMADSAASMMQPESEKSTAQSVGDTVSGNSNSSESLYSKAKTAMGMGDGN